MLPIVLLVRGVSFVSFGLYQTLWQYLGTNELTAIIRSAIVGSIFIGGISYFIGIGNHPRSVFVIDMLLVICSLGGLRILFKISTERLRNPHKEGEFRNVIIAGANDTGELLLREFIRRRDYKYRAVGFIDGDPSKVGVRIHGVKVIGTLKQLEQVVKLKKATEVILAMEEASEEEVRSLVGIAKKCKLIVRVVPEASRLFHEGNISLSLRPVDIVDLIGRELFEVDTVRMQSFYCGKTVLITGGAGSIGGELVRRVLAYQPKRLVILDNTENSLAEIQADVSSLATQSELNCILADVKDRDNVYAIMNRIKPNIVFHAAAHKHVPVVEQYYTQGIINNVGGTRNIVDAAIDTNVDRFMLISTDKAINPTSVMGASKRACEQYIQAMLEMKKCHTNFLTVRFGNVFNSRGSVVPLFKKQIENGGPITITHPDVSRYFMDISEAVCLILEATVDGKTGDIFILDMGKSIKIVDLAKDLLEMQGLSEDDIPIIYTGLHPGEKMKEEIETIREKATQSRNPHIRKWVPESRHNRDIVGLVDELLLLCKSRIGREPILEKLTEIVPEYRADLDGIQ